MRFRSQLTNISTFTKLTASLSSLGKICWVRLEEESIRFTIIPDQGTQVWAQLPLEILFDSYDLQSASDVINLEVPIGGLHRALRSAAGGVSARLRLTKKGNTPLLALTVVTSSYTIGNNPLETSAGDNDDPHHPQDAPPPTRQRQGPRDREAVVTQEIPVRVLHESKVEGLHEPRCPRPDVHIILPSLLQLKSISERFTKLATDTSTRETTSTQPTSTLPMLELSANMHGSLKLAIATDALRISTVWKGLVNPPLDPAQLSQDEIDHLPSERMRALGGEDGGEEGWAKVRIDGRDWGRVLSVGRLSPKVVACFIHETALILYVYLPGEDDSCLTYYINSYSS